jgi:hypothetical protein
LGASPAYIGKRVALLEDALRGQGVLDVYGQLDGALDNIQTEVRGGLRIAASSGLGRNHIAPVLSELVKMHPGVAEPAWLTTRDLQPMMLASGVPTNRLSELHGIMEVDYIAFAAGYGDLFATRQDSVNINRHCRIQSRTGE